MGKCKSCSKNKIRRIPDINQQPSQQPVNNTQPGQPSQQFQTPRILPPMK